MVEVVGLIVVCALAVIALVVRSVARDRKRSPKACS
jgi:hypothetical protein